MPSSLAKEFQTLWVYTTLIQNSIYSYNKKYKIIHENRLQRTTARRSIQYLKYFSYSVCGMAIRIIFDFSMISSRVLKHFPRSGFLSRPNRKNRRSGGIWWLLNGIPLVFSHLLTDNYGFVQRRVIMVQVSRVVCPQILYFLVKSGQFTVYDHPFFFNVFVSFRCR